MHAEDATDYICRVSLELRDLTDRLYLRDWDDEFCYSMKRKISKLDDFVRFTAFPRGTPKEIAKINAKISEIESDLMIHRLEL
jgi:hypothetical protein